MNAAQVVDVCRKMATAIAALDAATAARLGINTTDLRALNLLLGGSLSQIEMSRTMELARPSVSAMVDRLEASGFVHRRRANHDRRAVIVELSPAARRALDIAYRPAAQHVSEVARTWSANDRVVVVRGLGRLADVLLIHAHRATSSDPTPSREEEA